MNEKDGNLPNAAAYADIKATVTGKRIHYLNYTSDNEKLKEEIWTLLPKDTKLAEHCEYENATSECSLDLTTKNCSKVQFPVIKTLHNRYGTMCPENLTLPCDESECACNMIPWMDGQCSVTCDGHGTQTPWRNVSRNPTCKPTAEPKPCNKGSCSEVMKNSQSKSPEDDDPTNPLSNETALNSYTQLASKDNEKSDSTIIYAVVGVILVLIIVVTVVAIVVVINCRANRKKTALQVKRKKSIHEIKTQTTDTPYQGEGKNKALKVDLNPESGKSTRTVSVHNSAKSKSIKSIVWSLIKSTPKSITKSTTINPKRSSRNQFKSSVSPPKTKSSVIGKAGSIKACKSTTKK